MEIEELKSYKELWEYAKTVGYENLTDDDIEELCKRIKDIRDQRIEEHEKKKYGPTLSSALKHMEYSIAMNHCYQLRRCTPERAFAIAQEMSKAIELANYKEAVAREENADKVLIR